MSRLFYHTMQDNLGNLLFGVSGTMRLAGTGTLATIYGDEACTVIIPNPMTNHVSFASFKCFLPTGDFDFYMAKPGYTFETLTGIQGYGTMAQQDAAGVAITGGSIVGLGQLEASNAGFGGPTQVGYNLATGPAPSYFGGDVTVAGALAITEGNITGLTLLEANQAGIGGPAQPGYALATGAGAVYLGGAVTVQSNLGVGKAPIAGYVLTTGAGTVLVDGDVIIGLANASPNARLELDFDKSTRYGLKLRPLGSDGSPLHPVLFVNVAGTEIGSISSTASAVAYNTSSDARLKTAITPLTGALAVVQALKPIAHRWRVDDSPGVGFAAHEVQEVVDGVITGDKDAIDEAGQIIPQQMDYSKLVPWLTSALQETLAQVQALTERVQALEEGLGV